jgi:hypothetical protein
MKAITFYKVRKQSTSLEQRHSLNELRMKVPEANLPATLPYPDSSETVTKGQNNVIKMGANNRLKP